MRTDKLCQWMLLLSVIAFCPISASAQLSNPNERFGLTATVDGVTNTNYRWQNTDGDRIANGKMSNGMHARIFSNVKLVSTKAFSLSVAPFYTYSTTDFKTKWEEGAPATQTGWDTGRQSFTLPSEHHNYGGSVTAAMNMMVGSKALTISATGTANMSQYGYEHTMVTLSAMLHMIRTKETYLGLGAIYLIGSNVGWPLYPFITYRQQYNDKWSLSMMGANNYLNYQATKKVKYSVGMELDTEKYYFRPGVEGLPKKSVFSLISERFGAFTDIQLAQGLTMNIGAGASVPLYGRVRESGHRHAYMHLHDRTKPFVQLKMKYSIMKK